MGNGTAAHCFYLSKKCKAKPPVGSSTYTVIMAAAAVPGQPLPITIRGVFLPKGSFGVRLGSRTGCCQGIEHPSFFSRSGVL